MLSQEAVSTILGITDRVPVTSEEMAQHMKVTFFNLGSTQTSNEVSIFANRLHETLKELGVTVLPYQDALITIPLWKAIKRSAQVLFRNLIYIVRDLAGLENDIPLIPFIVIKNTLLNRKRVRSGVSVIALGESKTNNLPMDNTSSFRDTSVITIIDLPPGIDESTDFEKHFDTAMGLFAYHMTNIVIGVGEEDFVVYNFNASHPFYKLNDGKFKKHILESLIPKVVAPIRPHRFSDFRNTNKRFNVTDKKYSQGISEFVLGGKLFADTNLYPKGKKIDDLPFRNSFYRWVGKLHLDNRNGMSYGFLAWQLPTTLSELHEINNSFEKQHPSYSDTKDFFFENNELYIVIEIASKKVAMKVPDIWVLSQRSGSDKTKINPDKDLVKMGLSSGTMLLEAPEGLILDESYKPSFDTKVILAHAVGNAIIASIASHFDVYPDFIRLVNEKGLAIAHWHGYLNPNELPQGFSYYGFDRPHVSCSSPQSAIYALSGKLLQFKETLANKRPYRGDIQIEPQHGSNMNFDSIIGLAQMFLANPNLTVLGNKYLFYYKQD